MRNKGKLNTWYAMFFGFQEPHYNKKRHNCRPKATLESWAKDWWQASKKKTSATGWVSWVPWFPEADIQYKSEGKTIGKNMPRCCHTPWIKLSQKSNMRMTWEIHRNTMKYCTTEDTSSQHSQQICRQKCQCIKTFMSILDLQSEGRWHILRNASHAWSHLDYLNASKTFCICPKCINTSKIIQKDLKNKNSQKRLLPWLQLVLHHRTARHPKIPKESKLPPINDIWGFHVHKQFLSSSPQHFWMTFSTS